MYLNSIFFFKSALYFIRLYHLYEWKSRIIKTHKQNIIEFLVNVSRIPEAGDLLGDYRELEIAKTFFHQSKSFLDRLKRIEGELKENNFLYYWKIEQICVPAELVCPWEILS